MLHFRLRDVVARYVGGHTGVLNWGALTIRILAALTYLKPLINCKRFESGFFLLAYIFHRSIEKHQLNIIEIPVILIYNKY